MEIEGSKKTTDSVNVVLSERDLGIFEWLLDMKFSDVGVLDEKFFGGESKNLGGARTRLRKLERAGYLKAMAGYDGTVKKYYLATEKALYSLKSRYPEKILPSVLRQIRPATFDHDLKVLKLRMKLESLGRATNWESERVVRKKLFLMGKKLPNDLIPDGIYQNKIGKRVAFEMEIAPKTLKRYESKISEYVKAMSSEEPFFDYTLFVSGSDHVFKTLKELTLPYGKRFRVQKIGDILGEENV